MIWGEIQFKNFLSHSDTHGQQSVLAGDGTHNTLLLMNWRAILNADDYQSVILKQGIQQEYQRSEEDESNMGVYCCINLILW